MIYASDPDAAPDSEFTPGELSYLVPGNRGRLLDARRTPMMVTATVIERGAFEVEITAFEDAGARWELPLWDVARFQFAPTGARAAPTAVGQMRAAIEQFDRELLIEPAPGAAADTLARVAAARELVPPTPELVLDSPTGDPRLFELLEHHMAALGLSELDRRFTEVFVSNPSSGETVKGHAIVLAELGLCRFAGKAVRDPGLFAGEWSKPRRAEHLLSRMAFVQELFARSGLHEVTLYRGAAVTGPFPERAPASFVSATFSRAVAMEHFESAQTGVIWRQPVPVTRLLMTYLETRAMNQRFREAEAVLIGDPGSRSF